MLDRFFHLLRAPQQPQERSLPVSLPPSQVELSLEEGPLTALVQRGWFTFDGSNRADFYRYMRDHIPIVSSGIWTWVHLCATSQRVELTGRDEAEVARARSLVDALQRRIYPRADGDHRGIDRLTESAFWDLFTLGRVAFRIHLLPDAAGISHLEALDPFRIHWKRGARTQAEAWLEHEDGRFERLPEETLFYRSLISDLRQPGGVEPLASIPFVVEVEQRMLADMARSSHNAGTQRLQVRMTPPDRQPGEDYETYTRRANSYFDTTIRRFADLGPDDNVFTWSDVEVRLIGGQAGQGDAWKINREQVIEDVITGLKLFPWTLGRSHGTTKNWIFAQYNLLMQIVETVQRLGADLAEWLLQLELRLAGNLAEARWHYSPNQDPFIVERARARLMELERVEKLVEGGFVSRDQGARELGYAEAYRSSDPGGSGGE